jgi:hypothetical protein
MDRKQFLKIASSMAIVFANGDILQGADLHSFEASKRKVRLRFVVASDGHYGEKNTLYQEYYETLVNRINAEHETLPFAFCLINGDIVHDDKSHYPAVKNALDQLQPRYYVSQGNHDQVTPYEWNNIWNIPVNHEFSIKKNTFLVATTSDEKGTYLCPDVNWIETRLEANRSQENVFIFMHINPGKLTKYGIECSPLFELLARHKNVRAIFNGHDHDEEGIKMKNEIPFIFDAHFGGSWGTEYRGFRVVELLKDNSLFTYIMNPLEKINEATL